MVFWFAFTSRAGQTAVDDYCQRGVITCITIIENEIEAYTQQARIPYAIKKFSRGGNNEKKTHYDRDGSYGRGIDLGSFRFLRMYTSGGRSCAGRIAL
jgi:hypothetical protein